MAVAAVTRILQAEGFAAKMFLVQLAGQPIPTQRSVTAGLPLHPSSLKTLPEHLDICYLVFLSKRTGNSEAAGMDFSLLRRNQDKEATLCLPGEQS